MKAFVVILLILGSTWAACIERFQKESFLNATGMVLEVCPERGFRMTLKSDNPFLKDFCLDLNEQEFDEIIEAVRQMAQMHKVAVKNHVNISGKEVIKKKYGEQGEFIVTFSSIHNGESTFALFVGMGNRAQGGFDIEGSDLEALSQTFETIMAGSGN